MIRFPRVSGANRDASCRCNRLASSEGALGTLGTLREVYGETQERMCRVPKPMSAHGRVKPMIRMWKAADQRIMRSPPPSSEKQAITRPP